MAARYANGTDADGARLHRLDRAALVRFAGTVHDELTRLRDGRTAAAAERDALDAQLAVAVDDDAAAAALARARTAADRSAGRAAELGGRVRRQRARLACRNGAAADEARRERGAAAAALAARCRGQADRVRGLRAEPGTARRYRDRADGARLRLARLADGAADALDRRTDLAVDAAEARLAAARHADEAAHGARVRDARRGHCDAVGRTVAALNGQVAELMARGKDRCDRSWAPVPRLKHQLKAAADQSREAERLASATRGRNERLRARLRARGQTNDRLRLDVERAGRPAATDADADAARRLRTYKSLLDVELGKYEILVHENALLSRPT